MGADITLLNKNLEGEPTADLLIRTSSLKGTVIEGADIPTLIDEIPMLAVMAAFARGTTIIRDAQELKVKESDRIAVMVDNLKRMGADIEGTDDGMIIHGGKPLHGAVIDSHLDHRVAMSFAVAGTTVSYTHLHRILQIADRTKNLFLEKIIHNYNKQTIYNCETNKTIPKDIHRL